MDKIIRTTGIVKEIVDHRTFKISLEDGREVLTTLSTKAKDSCLTKYVKAKGC